MAAFFLPHPSPLSPPHPSLSSLTASPTSFSSLTASPTSLSSRTVRSPLSLPPPLSPLSLPHPSLSSLRTYGRHLHGQLATTMASPVLLSPFLSLSRIDLKEKNFEPPKLPAGSHSLFLLFLYPNHSPCLSATSMAATPQPPLSNQTFNFSRSSKPRTLSLSLSLSLSPLKTKSNTPSKKGNLCGSAGAIVEVRKGFEGEEEGGVDGLEPFLGRPEALFSCGGRCDCGGFTILAAVTTQLPNQAQ